MNVNNQLATLAYSSPDEVGFVCPNYPPGMPLTVTVATSAGESGPVSGTVQEVSPRILELRHPGSFEAPGERDFTMSSRPAEPGSEIVVLATGLGEAPAIRLATRVLFGGLEADSESIEADLGRPGVYAIRARVPEALPDGAIPVSLKIVSSIGVAATSNSVPAVIEHSVR